MNTSNVATEWSRDGQDGFRPLHLPKSGGLLYPGRQYYLTPVARLILSEVYGLRGLPSIIECLHKYVAKTRVTMRSENLETGIITEKVDTIDHQDATFRAYTNAYQKFTLNVEKITELEPFYVDSPKLPAYIESDERVKSRSGFGVRAPREKKVIDLSILDL